MSHKDTYIPSLLRLSPTPNQPITPLGHQRVPGWAPCVIQPLPTNSLFYTWQYIYISVLLFQFIPLSFPSMSFLDICIPIPALKITSSVPFFYLPYTCINNTKFVFLFLTSLCITDSRFIYLNLTDSHLLLFIDILSPTESNQNKFYQEKRVQMTKKLCKQEKELSFSLKRKQDKTSGAFIELYIRILFCDDIAIKFIISTYRYFIIFI